MKQLTENKQYNTKYGLLYYLGSLDYFDIKCDVCKKQHYNYKTQQYQKLYNFADKLDHTFSIQYFIGTTCIDKFITKYK